MEDKPVDIDQVLSDIKRQDRKYKTYVVIMLGMMLISAIGIGFIVFNQVSNTLRELDAQVKNIREIAASVTEDLKNQQEELNEQGTKLENIKAFSEEEIDKLWIVSYKKNKDKITDNKYLIKKISNQVSSQAKELKKLAQKNDDRAIEINQSLKDLKADISGATSTISEIQDSQVSQSEELKSLAIRIDTNERSLERLDNIERQLSDINAEVSRLNLSIDALEKVEVQQEVQPDAPTSGGSAS